MNPRLDLGALRKVKARDYLLRFFFGGLVAALAGWGGDAWGTAVGGIVLAFPSILPASLTLVQRHDGPDAAVKDARGARLGALGLLAFCALLFALADRVPAWLALLTATGGWFAAATLLFFTVGPRD